MKQLMIHTLLSEVVKGTLAHTPRKTGCDWTVALTHISTVSRPVAFRCTCSLVISSLTMLNYIHKMLKTCPSSVLQD